MISGFNTDIDYQGTTYHVQTEDKGAPARMIMTLVYDKGTILASKRSTYEDLSVVDFDEKEVTDRLSRQHKLMCAAVKAGRIDELVKMTRAASAGSKAKQPEPMLQPADAAMLAETIAETPRVPVPDTVPVVPAPLEPVVSLPQIKIGVVETEKLIRVVPDDMFEEELVIDAVHIIEDDEIEILPDDAVAVVSELSGMERSANQKLSLELLSDSKFKGGDRRTVSIMICRGTERKVVTNAQIMIKVLGSSFRPVIFHAKTDSNGLARVHLQLPHFQAGRAALLIRAITDGEEIELRRVVTPG
ncbi:MAG: hypothetical protein ABL999_19735 [Pyrinomonadaceae bacterium]